MNDLMMGEIINRLCPDTVSNSRRRLILTAERARVLTNRIPPFLLLMRKLT